MTTALSAFILLAVITGMFTVAGIAMMTLFRSEPIAVTQQINEEQELQKVFASFPDIKYSFNPSTGRLLLIGHVLSSADKSQLLYVLQGQKFVKSIDDSGIVIDEYVWSEINQIISRNPNWRGITVHSPTPGRFILSGYLQTRKEAEQLSDYMAVNFPYLDMLEKKIVVEEDVVNQIQQLLHDKGIRDINVQMLNGDLTLTGNIPSNKAQDFETIIAQARETAGVRGIKNFVASITAETGIINISDQYEVTGISRLGPNRYSVIINGRIQSEGDILDDMRIKSITPQAVFLERGGNQYRIDVRSK
jgi:type III secretion system YscD/HrpQ family protein